MLRQISNSCRTGKPKQTNTVPRAATPNRVPHGRCGSVFCGLNTGHSTVPLPPTQANYAMKTNLLNYKKLKIKNKSNPKLFKYNVKNWLPNLKLKWNNKILWKKCVSLFVKGYPKVCAFACRLWVFFTAVVNVECKLPFPRVLFSRFSFGQIG